jgi:hypothetical protein
MNAVRCFENGKLAEATAGELNAVNGGANYSMWNNGYGVIFFSTGIAYVNADGKSGGFVPNDGSKPTTWKS